jgi:glycosyltransferase involved in cell wall biosynthesis
MDLSIITISLNNPEGLRKTIESVVNQTFTEFEYIIIDGGSNDGSVEIIKEHDDKIAYWISEPDKGIYNAMNKGIKKASAGYCLFLNSGDYLVNSSVLETCFKNSFTEDLIYGNIIHDRQGELITYKLPQTLSFYDFYVDSIGHPATFIKRSLFDDIGFYNEKYKIVSDWEFFLKAIFLKRASLKYIDMEIAVVNCEGISMNSSGLTNEERSSVLKELFPGFIEDYKKLYSYNCSSASIHTANRGIRMLVRGFNHIIEVKRRIFS